MSIVEYYLIMNLNSLFDLNMEFRIVEIIFIFINFLAVNLNEINLF